VGCPVRLRGYAQRSLPRDFDGAAIQRSALIYLERLVSHKHSSVLSDCPWLSPCFRACLVTVTGSSLSASSERSQYGARQQG
jgi:hypothetical protein